MPRFAVHADGVVTNVVDGPADWPAMAGVDADQIAPSVPVGRGWARTGVGTYTAPAAPPVAAPAASVPMAVTMRKARLALLGAGKLAAVESAIDALSEPAKTAARIEWDYSNEVRRHNGLVASLGPALGLTDAEIDALFRVAAGL